MPPLARCIDGPVAVIGDIHGEIEKLERILDQLRRTPAFERRWVVLIGDFVDRGPDPRGVIEAILRFQQEHPRTTALAGNHEFAMAAALGLIPTPEYSNWGEQWLAHYDAAPTFASYGVKFGQLAQLAQKLPDAHREFLAGLPWCVEHPQLLFVHAGLCPNMPFDVQLRILREKDFALGKPQWLCEKFPIDTPAPPGCRLTLVCGHVPVPRVVFQRQRILIDTCHATGELSCVLLPERQVLNSAPTPARRATPASQPWWRFWRRAA